MRAINKLVVHCAATKPSMDIGAADIRRWHLDQGWSDIGYHYVIRRSGVVEKGRPDDVVGAHVKGHNADSLGICLVGGVDEKGEPQANYTPEQWASLERVLEDLQHEYNVPDEDICGHRDFPGVTKACPCFNVQAWWNEREPEAPLPEGPDPDGEEMVGTFIVTGTIKRVSQT